MKAGLGCLRLAPGELEGALREAVARGVPWIDAARTYPGSEEAIGRWVPDGAAKIVTKCGMAEGWRPDGRAATILADARASCAALGRPPDLLLLHAPDPAVDLATSVRALGRALALGLARSVGLSNVTRGQIEEAAAIVPLSGIEVALGPYADAAARGGVVAWCRKHGVPLLAYSVLGGPAHVARLRRDPVVRQIAERHATTPEAVMLGHVRGLDPVVIPLLGARTAAQVEISDFEASPAERDALDARFPRLAAARELRAPVDARAEVVLLMGLPGAGKSRIAQQWVDAGYQRLNRDELGGTLRGIVQRLREALAAGATRVVLDNTYLTRAVRSDVLRAAHAGGARVRCVHMQISVADAQVNLATRMLERHGALLAEPALTTTKDPQLFGPIVLHRMQRQLEPPGADEGFAAIETIPFARTWTEGRTARFVPAAAARAERERFPDALLLVYGWGGDEAALRSSLGGAFDIALCPHAGGPPVCWCRPPLPGLVVALAHRNGVDLRASTFVATTPAEHALGAALGLSVDSS